MDRRVTPPKRVTSPTWGPPTPCKQESRSRAVLRTTEGGGCWMGLEMRPIIQSPEKETKAMEPVFVFLHEVEVVFIFDSWSCQTRAQRESNYIEDQHWFHRGRLNQNHAKNSIFGVDFKNFNMISSVVVCFTLLSSTVCCFNHLLKHATINASMLRWPASKLVLLFAFHPVNGSRWK